MLFSSLTFIALFLPAFLLCYFAAHFALPKVRDFILVLFSLFFYAWGEPLWVLALLFSGTLDYCCGMSLGRHSGPKHRRKVLLISLVCNLGLLFVFKYSGFVCENLNAAFGLGIPVPTFNLPLGISFYTFQTLSYTIDVCSGKVERQKSYIAFMAYVTMFPQLVAGPIVRYADIAQDLKDRRLSLENFSKGVTRFSIGLAKKVVLANPAGAAASMLLAEGVRLTAASAWLGITFFAFQIYFDFSGYSDMAIGMGKMAGFTFPENFTYPYEATSISDFWRRWHISLSSFFRDYVYIPLGGNRKRQIRNIAVVRLLTGFWHGASWNFILWGAYYGLLLLLERYPLRRIVTATPPFLSRIVTFVAVLAGWGLFYFTDFADLTTFFKAFLFIDVPLTSFLPGSILISHAWLMLALVIGSTSLPKKAMEAVLAKYPQLSFSEPVYAAACVVVSFFMLLGQTYNPFLYFRF